MGKAFRRTLGKSTLLAKLLGSSSTSGDSALLEGKSSRRAGAVAQGSASLDLLGFVSGNLPLDLLGGMNLAGMSYCRSNDGCGSQRGRDVAKVDHDGYRAMAGADNE